ncbi:hypothetical protein NC653_004401 [Populus alba x Populus x berolinensis]|uniref:Uncharacterized protein n=1 Tax=Populus alba x Populus x berolinensis TaxID=444605 RepID=A0AAD6RWB9_9ROSI|nr:hypothetical protein NC653_004401 [Populus alba x Populus x berolinensis]
MAQDSYNRGQEHPFFAGLLRGNESGSRSISRSTSDIGDFRSKNFSDISGKSKDLPIKDSVSDILEPFEQTAFGTLWKIPTSTSFEFQSSQFDSSVDSGGTNDSVKASSPDTFETTEAHQNVGSLASIIMYAFYLNETLESDEFCTTLKEAVVEVFNCRKAHFGESVYPWVENVTLGQDCSCCTLISEKLFLTSPELLAWQGFSRLLFVPYALSFNLPGKPDATGSRLIVSNIGMSSIGVSIEQFLAHELSSTEEIKYFQRDVGEASVAHDCIGREILVSAETMEHMRNLLSILSSNASHLPLKAMHQPGLRVDMKAFEIDKVTSRKTIERLLEEFGGASKG